MDSIREYSDGKKTTYEDLEPRIKELEKQVIFKAEQIQVSGVNMGWDVEQGYAPLRAFLLP